MDNLLVIFERYSVYSLISTTLPSFPGRPVHTEHIPIPPEGYSRAEQLLSTAFLMLGTHCAAGLTEAIWNKLSYPRPPVGHLVNLFITYSADILDAGWSFGVRHVVVRRVGPEE